MNAGSSLGGSSLARDTAALVGGPYTQKKKKTTHCALRNSHMFEFLREFQLPADGPLRKHMYTFAVSTDPEHFSYKPVVAPTISRHCTLFRAA